MFRHAALPAVLALAACVQPEPGASFDGSYRLLTIDGKPIPGTATMTIAGKSVRGSAPCNEYWTTNGADWPAVKLAPIASTRRQCYVEGGEADAMITGITSTFAQSYREVRRVIDPEAGRTPFGIHVMVGQSHTVFIADTTMNERPTAEQMTDIAEQTAAVARRMGHEPRVAFLRVLLPQGGGVQRGAIADQGLVAALDHAGLLGAQRPTRVGHRQAQDPPLCRRPLRLRCRPHRSRHARSRLRRLRPSRLPVSSWSTSTGIART